MQPFFSVIIPLYNKEKFIKKTLKSIINQSFKDFEIIIVNDGSTDRSFEQASKINDKRIRIYNQNNQGLSNSRNNAIKYSTGNYIAMIDADDFWKPHHLKQLYRLIKDFPEQGMYASGYVLKKSEKIFHRAKFNGLDRNFRGIVPDFFKHSMHHCIAWVGAICIPKPVFESIGNFDPEIFSEQDIDLYIRIALNYGVALDDSAVTAIYNRTMDDNLSNYSMKKTIPKFLNSYKKEEKHNIFFKRYMNLNRFSTAIFFKLTGNKNLERKLIKDISLSHLTIIQHILLKSPNFIVKLLFLLKDKMKLNPFYVFKL